MDWREEGCSKEVKCYFGPTIHLWLQGQAIDKRRRNPGEVVRLLVEEAFERAQKKQPRKERARA